VAEPCEGQLVADLCVTGGYTQYAIRPGRFLVPVPNGVDLAEAVCIPLSYLTALHEARFQALGEIDGRVYMLVFTPRGGDVHVISLRKANRREIKRYEEEKEIPRD
jgi:uncharacterized DUF497 family protein